MKKVINPVRCEVNGRFERGFCKVEFTNGNLSISGVIGPRSNGGCKGSCGQCEDEIRKGIPTEGWTQEMVEKFCDIWDEWHLNDMRPYCQHQKKLGWDKLAGKPAKLYNYRLSRIAIGKRRAAESAALNALRNGEMFSPTEEQVRFATIPYSMQLPEEISGENALYYEPKKPLYPGDVGATEVKKLGWLKPDEHPDGILCKPCPVCGYKYGSKWLKEEVPADVIDWLFALPETTVKPAWV